MTESRALLMSAFDAAHPVERRRELRGREEQLETMFDSVLYQRKHAIVHGARGSGKTSLVRVFADHADREGVVLIYLACDARTDFGGLMRPCIRFVPASNIPVGRERAFRAQVEALGEDFGPRALVSLLVELAPKPLIFILDEFDRVTDPGVQDAVATTMKLLSDAKAPVQLLVVGIARSVTDLIDYHPSLRRHMVAIPVRRIADAEIARLIDDAATQARLAFDPAARTLLVTAACGSPYHARFFGYHAGLQALGKGETRVSLALAFAGLDRAVQEWGQLNEGDHDLFVRLSTADPATRDALVEVATLAAREQWLPAGKTEAPGRPALQMLGTALESGEGGQVHFRDSLAPQFLLATLLARDEGEHDAVVPRVANFRE